MSANQQNPPKRPRLSLQIKAISSGPNLRASRTIAAVVNPTSPTSFNTLSNVYATAIDRSTPVTAINTKQPLKLQTHNLSQPQHGPALTTPYGAPASFVSTYPDTPLTAQPISPAVAQLQDFQFPSSMTATPPLSAGPVDSSNENKRVFSFDPSDTASTITQNIDSFTANSSAPSNTAPTPIRRRATTANLCVSRPAVALPYTRNRSLHSILRNSPLPPPTARTPISPRRQSARLADRAARRVCYHSPIEQEIINDQYVRSHIDLLLDGGNSSAGPSPVSPLSASTTTSTISTAATEATGGGDEIIPAAFMLRDGGMTPGPFEEMRRRMAGMGTRNSGSTPPASPSVGSPTGIRKRRRKERSRRWVWTIGTQEGETDEEDETEVGGAMVALRAAAAAAAKAQLEPQQQQQQQQQPKPEMPRAAVPKSLTLVTVQPMLESPMEIVTPSIETFEEAADGTQQDVLMYESEPDAETAGDLVLDHRRALSLTPGDMDFEMVTPTVAGSNNHSNNYRLQPFHFAGSFRHDSEGLFNPETGSRRDTPVPADLVAIE